MVKTVIITGYKNTGKTRTIEKLITEFKKRNKKIGVIKHIPEENFSLDKKGTDTERFASSGANLVIGKGKKQTLKYEKKPQKIRELILEHKNLDIILLESFKELQNYPRIIIGRERTKIKNLITQNTIGIIGPKLKNQTSFKKDEIPKLANLIEKKAKKIPNNT